MFLRYVSVTQTFIGFFSNMVPDYSTTTTSVLMPTGTTVSQNSDEVLRPDPGTEASFQVRDNPFAFSPGQLNKLLNPKSLPVFRALGGLQGIARGLRTDLSAGLSVDEKNILSPITFNEAVQPTKEWPASQLSGSNTNSSAAKSFTDRIRVYEKNNLPAKKPTPIWRLMWIAFNEKVLILLTVAGVISLALGLYETFGVEREPGDPVAVDWVEGVAICVAVIIVVLVGSHNDWQKEKAFVKLNTKKDEREVKAMRSGKPMMIQINDILVGDVLFIEPGDIVPADGVFIDGHDVKCDESSATGESDAVRKTGGDRVHEILESGGEYSKDLDPFVISGSRVLEG